jgi:hypothetical protein
MRGKIIAINRKTGFHAVRTEDGDITVFELLDSEMPELGDEVTGALDSLGSETLFNATQKHEFSVFVQDAHCSEVRAKRMLNL